ncbi:NitT/TauT family transport system permease protein [Enhydrobacter aerosaccus]|uniref:NitT/TauT family transport system permease protein n=1 Tax=Enhydrobacter aerosaccus TaxID=225324 RepID=A0A1T4K1K8_9HYPH|nr:ABC transporter permease [Enhydrobacter aerosaccus]SJZ36177.1 NitT/TauT family transport system permease protein [Enhydrobacter aerosaccus]
MTVATPPDYTDTASAAGPTRPAAVARLFASMAGEGLLAKIVWTFLSIGLFAGLWEFCWAAGWADPKLLPPPHIFLGSIVEQAKFFNTATRWQVGQSMNAGPSAFESVMITVGATTMRVFVGLLIASVLGIGVGILIRYSNLFDKLVLPTVTLLSPVSPIAWLPVAIFLFGIGNGPAIFMVVVALFFHMVLATVTQIDGVSPNLINVARTVGATKRQIYGRVILPAILPGMLAVLRMNLFGAWMVVLVAESTGVGYGLGQVIMLARNTFNPSLVFFTIAVIGLLGFTFDWLLRQAQRRILYWLPDTKGKLRGL